MLIAEYGQALDLPPYQPASNIFKSTLSVADTAKKNEPGGENWFTSFVNAASNVLGNKPINIGGYTINAPKAPKPTPPTTLHPRSAIMAYLPYILIGGSILVITLILIKK
ncbi:MAG TPA: hypothetical protein ENG87_02760 [Candidatus Pacearchaeota archaeon]|nr:hypothetical protein [Candidatus Pacearchaeota archaeon]